MVEKSIVIRKNVSTGEYLFAMPAIGVFSLSGRTDITKFMNQHGYFNLIFKQVVL